MVRLAPAASPLLVLLVLGVAGAPPPAGAQATTPSRSPRPAKDATGQPPPEPVRFACQVRGPFGSGTRYYSQFYEDYILSYVFRDTAKGIYVDVGAHDPDTLSVTKHFYLKGWRGVNIEPSPVYLAKLRKGRPGDVNLGVGISDEAATLTFYQFEPRASGLSTFDPEIARRHRQAGYAFEELTIPVVTLTDALARSGMVTGGFEILNVDVEGFERKVLAGLDMKRFPPKVVILEATAPLTEEPTQHQWEGLLFERGYTFALDDGLNRYYVQRTAPELVDRFLEAGHCVARDKRAKGIKLDGFLPEPAQ